MPDPAQAAKPEFYCRMVPLLDGGDDVGMVLSPQTFHNINRHTDIFNHFNVQFWEYAQHGYDAIGFISCTGAWVARCADACIGDACCRHR